MKTHWRVRQPEYPTNLLEELLRQRQIANPSTFLQPNYERDLHDPYLLRGMKEATELIVKTIKNSERIAVVADYDADGIPGAAIITEFFRQINFTNFEIFIPDRQTEAYGLSIAAVEKLAAAGAKLLITIDCGISNVAEVALARNLGLAVIITDHHLPPAELPPANAIINPHQIGDTYPEQVLCGAGVVFKLIQALAPQLEVKPGWEKWLLDLVAIATVSDMVPLVGENRALVHFGLRVLRQTRRLGLRRMFEVLRLELPAISENDIAFSLGPRLNAASRMASATDAYRFLTTTSLAEADALARHLEAQNTARKAMVGDIVLASRTKLVGLEQFPVLVLGDTTWSPTGLGLVAGRLAEAEQRPVFVWGKNGDGMIKGSARSVPGVNLVELMTAANQLADGELFVNFGGHAMAGGFSLASEQQALKLAATLQQAYRVERVSSATPELLIDSIFSLENLDAEAFAAIESCAPYGIGNPRPLFLFNDITISGVKKFGSEKNHLELVFDANSGGAISAVQFFAPPALLETTRVAQRVDLVASLEKNCFRGRTTWRLRIVDLDQAS